MTWLATRRARLTAAGLCALALGGAVAGVLLASSASAGSTTSTGTISVTGNGQAVGTPDTVTLQMGVSTTAPSASAALDRNDSEMASLEQSFTSAGVPTSGLQTSGLDLDPNYDNSGNVDGYEADDELTVTLHDVGEAGSLIDTAAHAVGNDVRIEGISFSISDTSSLLRSARTQAMQDAAAEAGQLASAAGARLGPVLKVTDEEQLPQSPSPIAFSGAVAMRAAASVPVQAGTSPISVQVQVVYALEG